MKEKTKSKSKLKISPKEILTHKDSIPKDHHCKCDYCVTNFLGEIYDTKNNLFYNSRARYSYYPKKDVKNGHLDPGHYQGYRWAIQQFTEPGDWILDPTVGTGTAIVEAINNGRNGIGIELEYAHLTQEAIDSQYERPTDKATGKYFFRQGDAKNIGDYLEQWGVKKNSIQMIINGTPYPKLSGKSSDSPERKVFSVDKEQEKLVIDADNSFDYYHPENIGLTKGNDYWNLVNTMYKQSLPYLKPGGFFVTIIKDMVQEKKPYLLHNMVTDSLLQNPELEYYGSFIHHHWPPTLFMSTYPLRFPDVKVPRYQTGIVLRKKS
jgi:hypothetical protein